MNSENPLCERLGELFSERRVIERSGADIEQAFAAVREYCAGKGISIERLWYDRDASSMDVLEYVFNAGSAVLTQTRKTISCCILTAKRRG